MGLTDRLAAAQRARTESNDAPAERTPATSTSTSTTATAVKPKGKPAATRDPFDEVKRVMHAQLVASLGPKLYDVHMTQSELESNVRLALQAAIAASDVVMSGADRTRITQEVSDDILGYGPLEPLLRDGDLSEVMVNAYDSIYVERGGKLVKTGTAFSDEAHLRRTIDKIVGKIGRRVDEASPMVDARLPDGSRVNAIIPPLALDGSKLTIRKFSEDPYTVQDLINFGSLSEASAGLLEACVRGRLNILVSGRYGRRQDHHPQRAVVLHPRRRAHRDHRGRSGAAARPGPRAPARVAPAQHRGQGRHHHPRPGQELPPHAS